MNYLALILVSIITTSSIIIAVKEGWVGTSKNDPNEQVLSSTTYLDQIESAFSELKNPLYFDPVTIQIGEKVINIEEISLHEDGTLEAPKLWENAGWYPRSAKPGQEGNTIIDGHYDNDQGQPAAFWDLKTLSADDKVLIKDEIGRSFTYTVKEIFFVDITDPERTNVLDESEEDKAELTIVTCGGVWDPSIGTYDRRLVIKAELDSAAPAGR